MEADVRDKVEIFKNIFRLAADNAERRHQDQARLELLESVDCNKIKIMYWCRSLYILVYLILIYYKNIHEPNYTNILINYCSLPPLHHSTPLHHFHHLSYPVFGWNLHILLHYNKIYLQFEVEWMPAKLCCVGIVLKLIYNNWEFAIKHVGLRARVEILRRGLLFVSADSFEIKPIYNCHFLYSSFARPFSVSQLSSASCLRSISIQNPSLQSMAKFTFNCQVLFSSPFDSLCSCIFVLNGKFDQDSGDGVLGSILFANIWK